MALKVHQKRNGLHKQLTKKAIWPFAFNQLVLPCDSNQIRQYGLESKSEIYWPSLTTIGPYGWFHPGQRMTLKKCHNFFLSIDPYFTKNKYWHLVDLANTCKCIYIFFGQVHQVLYTSLRSESPKLNLWGPLLTLNWYIKADPRQYLNYI